MRAGCDRPAWGHRFQFLGLPHSPSKGVFSYGSGVFSKRTPRETEHGRTGESKAYANRGLADRQAASFGIGTRRGAADRPSLRPVGDGKEVGDGAKNFGSDHFCGWTSRSGWVEFIHLAEIGDGMDTGAEGHPRTSARENWDGKQECADAHPFWAVRFFRLCAERTVC